MSYDTLILYSAVSFFYIISPGPAVFLAIYNGAINGVKSVVISALGNMLGLFLLSSLSITGLSALLLASSAVFMAVKIVGACYLVFLGIKQIHASQKIQAVPSQVSNKKQQPLTYYFKEGMLIAITNPKPIIFFAALFPQFLNTQQPLFLQFSVMTLIFMLFSFVSLSTYGYLAQRAKAFFAKPKSAQWFQLISGGLFIFMGISLLSIKSAT